MLALLDSRALVCFLDEEFTKLHKILLDKKQNSIYVEVIDGRLFSFGDVTFETAPLNFLFDSHNS